MTRSPEIDEENSTLNPPLAAPTMDMEATEDREEQDGLSDNESVLSEVDEAQFEDFDPANIAIEDRPAIAVDDSNVGLIGVHKRKRTEEGEGGKKKRKEARREKPKKNKKRREDDDDAFSGGEEIEGKRVRKRKEGGEKKERARARRATPVEDDESLTPEERRKRALDRAMDEALRNPNKRRRKADGIDLDGMQDAEIEEMRRRMTEAAQADNNARKEGKIVAQKLKLLPEVVSLLNRNNIANNLVDPDTNLLEAVRFFLEPLEDGSMPAYNIQRELFAALGKLPITKETLLQRNDWRKREVAEADYDPTRLPLRQAQSQSSQALAAAAARERALAKPNLANRARVETPTQTYTIAPRSNVPANAQPVGRSGADDQLRRMRARMARGRR
ncbi:Transcription factor iws1 [Coniosporium tulheliwenetii]|uniref:Transcription factor iws1 n=1 Tax=Coniosporium tulheliwenetii TaxID=3383036 RepID=A0ACC2Z2S8_9PEZI|nr:Transcription factor iws1 [Cladosporium sp. JES 115]